MTDLWEQIDLSLPKCEEIRTLEAGWRTDALIAHWVFGRTGLRIWNGLWLQDSTGRTTEPFSEDDAKALLVKKAESPTGKGFWLEDCGKDGPERYICQFGQFWGEWSATAMGPTIALAVCRARLLAARIHQDRESDAEVERWMDQQGYVCESEE